MTVITAWRDGRIQGWVEPPVLKVADDEVTHEGEGEDKALPTGADRKEIVKEWAAEFKLEGLWRDDGDGKGNDAMQIES